MLKCTGTSTLLFEIECLYTVLRAKKKVNNDKSNIVMWIQHI